MTQEVAAYNAGRNAVRAAIVNDPYAEVRYTEAALKKAFYQGARDAFVGQNLPFDLLEEVLCWMERRAEIEAAR